LHQFAGSLKNKPRNVADIELVSHQEAQICHEQKKMAQTQTSNTT
jgi:hypothetical protein